MSANLKRIFISFFISVVGVVATWFFFIKYYPAVQFHINEKPLAKVEKLENSSRRKLAQHRTWQIVEFGDSLYSGESIKTSSDADLALRFLDSNTILNLEADSLITIKQDKGEISLNLVEGHLFVDSTNNQSTASLKLESKDGLIDLTKTRATLSKEKNSDLNVNVISGQARVLKADGQSTDITLKKATLLITEPQSLSTVDSKTAEVKIVWLSSDISPTEKVIFKVGTKRSDLTAVEPLSRGANEAVLPVKFGKNFVQVEVRSAEGRLTQAAASVRFELQPIVEPFAVVAEPVPVSAKAVAQVNWLVEKEEVQNYLVSPEINLNWNLQNKDSVKKISVKVFADEKLVLNEILPAEQTSFKTTLKKPGRYVASIEVLDEADKSLAQSKLKTIISAQLAFLASPEWSDSKSESNADLNGTYLAKWKSLENIEDYNLELVNPSGVVVKTWSQKNNFVQLKNLVPGEYKLTLTTLDQFKRISPNKSVKIIKVADSSAITAPKLKKMRFK